MFYLILFISYANSALLSVIEISRHGARQALKPYPWNAYDWEVNVSDLTHEGLIQHYLIGRELRYRYVQSQQFLPKSYDLEKIYISSTDTARTIMSTQGHMFGLYPDGPVLTQNSNQYTATPPFDINNLNDSIKGTGLHALPYHFQPVSIEVQPIEKDPSLIVFSKSCPRMDQLVRDVENSEKHKNRIEAYNKNIKNRLEKILNAGEIKYEDVAFIADSFECIEFAGFDKARNILGNIYDEILEIRNYTNAYLFSNKEALDLSSSFMYTEILQTFKGIVEGSGKRMFSLYMTHDTNLVAYLTKLNKYNGQNPPFASSIIFELHKEKENFIKVFYNDQQLKLDFCELNCKLEQFENFINSWAYANLGEACLLKGQLESFQTKKTRDLT